MTRPGIRAIFAILGLLACSACGPVIAGISQDNRLATPIEFTARSAEVSELLSDLSKQLKTKLTAEPVLAATPISARLSKRTGSAVLTSIADLLFAEWVKDGDGYKLVRTKDCLDKEAQIMRDRGWTIAERFERIETGLSTPAAEWKAATTGKNSFSYPGKHEQIHGLTMPDDFYIAQRLAYPYSRAILALLTTVPLPAWDQATDPAGVELPLARLPQPQRDKLADVYSSDVEVSNLERWPDAEERKGAAEALRTGKGKLFLQLLPDQLGRWATAHFAIRSSGRQIDSDLPIGRDFPDEHIFNHVMVMGKPGTETYMSYQKMLPDSDSRDTVGADPWMVKNIGSLTWPPEPSGDKAASVDDLLDQLVKTVPVDYMSTVYDSARGLSRATAPFSRGRLINGAASSMDATWERARGVILFRERNWPFKRERIIPHAFFADLADKLSPNKQLSIDDLAAASDQLSPKQKHWWRDQQNTLPLSGYAQVLTWDNEHAFDIWQVFTADEKQRMKISYSPEPGHDPFAGGKGISIKELSPQARQDYLTNRILAISGRSKADFDDVRIGWMHYRVSDGYDRDRLDFELLKNGQMTERSCFFEFFHPRPQDWK